MAGLSAQAYVPGTYPSGGTMSTSTDNTRKAYAAFASGDIATLTELIAPDCAWHVGGRSPLAGTYTGHEEILGYFGQLATQSGGTFKAELIDCAELPNTGMVLSLVQTGGTMNGLSPEVRMVQLGRSDDQGRIVECWWFSEDQYAQDAAFTPQEIVLPGQKKTQPVKA
jgi:ketosteroid isomerase-like protein